MFGQVELLLVECCEECIGTWKDKMAANIDT